MRTLVMWCLAALAAGLLIPMTGCTEGGGMTDVLTYMSSSPVIGQSKIFIPWVWLMTANGADFQPVFDAGAPEGGIAQGQLSPDGASIVFIRLVEGSYEICRYDLATGTVAPLYTGDVEETPAWSPDGQTIIFSGNSFGTLYTMDADDGGNLTPLVGFSSNMRNPSYNRAGTKIVYMSGATDIIVANPDGSDPDSVYYSDYVLHPAWTPDGRIIFADDDDYNGNFDILMINQDGSGLTNLTETPSVNELHPTSNYAGNLIAWSVGGKSSGGEIFVAAFNGTALVGEPVNVTTDAPAPCWAPTFGRIPTAQVNSIFNPIL